MRTKTAAAVCAVLLLSGCGGSASSESSQTGVSSQARTAIAKTKTEEGKRVETSGDNTVLFKALEQQNNPLITNIFCADPTAVEYEGRLYVFGTNDQQQYLEKGGENTYERIKSFVILSTDDMANWRYEGTINTGEIAPWVYASWAPSVVKRTEEDGKTHFYLYFSNSGNGVGVLTAEDPRGPWSDPLGKPLIYNGMEGLKNSPQPFDPGAVIDDDGTGWLAFGGGRANSGTDLYPGTARIVKLGEDMLSFDSDFVEIKAPYFFEASELNFFGGKYIYTFNTSWEKRTDWDHDSGKGTPPTCSMCYMTSSDPLDTDSWEYQEHYLKNPGQLGMEYSNNHTHLQKFGDKYYLFYHTLILQKELGVEGGYRSIGADEVEVDEENAVINECFASRTGTKALKNLSPYEIRQGEEGFLTDCEYGSQIGVNYAKCESGKVIAVKNVDFGDKAGTFKAVVRGSGTLEMRLDSIMGDSAVSLSFDCKDWAEAEGTVTAGGVHDIYFVFDGKFDLDSWETTEK